MEGVLFGNEMIDVKEINNPVDDIKDDVILKKEGEIITIDGLKAILEKIRWRMIPIGCDFYAPVNHKGERVNFEIRSSSRGHWEGEKNERYVADYDELELRLFRDEVMFGTQEHSGFMTLELSKCEIRKSSGSLFLSTGGFCLFLSNYDKKWMRVEAYIHSLPKLFQIKLKCDNCGHVVNTSNKMSSMEIVDNWTQIVLSGPLATRACKKCGESTYSDMNASYKMRIYKDGKKQPLKFEQVKADADKLYMKEYYKLADEDRKEREEAKGKAKEVATT